MKRKFVTLTFLAGFLLVNTVFVEISERGFSAFAEKSTDVHILIPASAQWRYLAAKNLKTDNWRQLSFDDSDWPLGKSGFGYGDDDDRTKLDTMRGEYDTLIIRHKFDLANPATIKQLYLYMRFDDAFIAYLNGHEIARSGIIQHGFGHKIESHEASGYELFTIKTPFKYLHEGENLLAVAGFNRSLDSSDFSIEPVLASIELESPELPVELSKDEWYSDLDYFQSRLEDQSSYLLLGKFDYKKALRQLKNAYHESAGGLELAQELQKIIAQIGDAHAGIEVILDAVNDRYLPFLIADTSAGVVALNAEQSGFIEQGYPLLKSIDGLPLEQWLEAAAKYVPQVSSQLIRYQSLKQLRSIDRMRAELDIAPLPYVEITLESMDGVGHRTLSLRTSDHRLSNAKLKLGESKILDGNIGYLRIPSMYRSPDETLSTMAKFKDTDGLIIDVRDNRGGRYAILEALYGFFIDDTVPPYVSNIAAYRLSSRFDDDHLHYRPTYRFNHEGWTLDQKASIESAISTFEPEWAIPREKFSEWHFMVLDKAAEFKQYRYRQPVVVLSNAASFSATDGFLSAFSDLPQVTIVGEASGGGSGATQDFRLPNSGIEVNLSSMASFRPNGKLYDGNGIEVDIPQMPEPDDFLGYSDVVLERAISLIHEKL